MTYELTRWDPFEELVSLQEGGIWAPAIDVEENKDEVIVRAELPGMKREEIKLQIQGDVLTLTGERKWESETKDKRVHLTERAYGKFQRSLPLPSVVDGTGTKASYEVGVLTVRLPKREEAKPKEIAIEVK